jgi:hypothetical protein
MTWRPVIEYEEVTPKNVRSTRKKVWDPTTNSWKDRTIWAVIYNQDTVTWLEQHYPEHNGWGTIGQLKVIMEEPVYLHYCLTRPA